MENKNYAYLAHLIFGEKSDFANENELNSNEQLANYIDETVEELFEPLELEYMSINEFVLEGKTKSDFADYIRENADDIAAKYMGKALIKMRHPSVSKEIRSYVEFKENDE